jgi:hypothetical protein
MKEEQDVIKARLDLTKAKAFLREALEQTTMPDYVGQALQDIDRDKKLAEYKQYKAELGMLPIFLLLDAVMHVPCTFKDNPFALPQRVKFECKTGGDIPTGIHMGNPGFYAYAYTDTVIHTNPRVKTEKSVRDAMQDLVRTLIEELGMDPELIREKLKDVHKQVAAWQAENFVVDPAESKPKPMDAPLGGAV